MTTDATLPTIVVVQSKIHALPERPDFMISSQLAKVYGTNAKHLMRHSRSRRFSSREARQCARSLEHIFNLAHLCLLLHQTRVLVGTRTNAICL